PLRDHLRCEHVGRAKPARTARPARTSRPATATKASGASGSTWSTPALSAWTATGARSALRRHRGFIIDLRRCDDDQTFRTLTRVDDFAVIASLERRLETVQAQASARALGAVTAEA